MRLRHARYTILTGHGLPSDNIYTGKVVAVTPQQPDRAQGDDDTTDVDPEHSVRIGFELEHILKGYPQHTSWQYRVPPETYCPGDFCEHGADHYTLGSEIFYITDSGGNIISDGAMRHRDIKGRRRRLLDAPRQFFWPF